MAGHEVMTGGTVSEWERTFCNALIKLSLSDLYAGGPTEAIEKSWSPIHECKSLGGNLEESTSALVYYLAAKKKAAQSLHFSITNQSCPFAPNSSNPTSWLMQNFGERFRRSLRFAPI